MHISLKTPLFLPFCTGCNKRRKELSYTFWFDFVLTVGDAKAFLRGDSAKMRVCRWNDITVKVYIQPEKAGPKRCAQIRNLAF